MKKEGSGEATNARGGIGPVHAFTVNVALIADPDWYFSPRLAEH